MQEQVQKLTLGTIPRSMWVVLEDDLVDCCKPGDDVILTLVLFHATCVCRTCICTDDCESKSLYHICVYILDLKRNVMLMYSVCMVMCVVMRSWLHVYVLQCGCDETLASTVSRQ